MRIQTNLLPVRSIISKRSGFKMPIEPARIIIHEVSFYPNQIPDSVRNDWAEGKDEIIGHYIIGTDGLVLNTIPDLEMCRHTKDCFNPYTHQYNDYNTDSISIFVIPETLDGNLTDKTIQSLNELCSYLRDTYPSISEIITGFMANGKPEPQYFMNPENLQKLAISSLHPKDTLVEV